MNIEHMSTSFTNNKSDCAKPVSWQVRFIAARHRLPVQRAALIAELVGLPVHEVRHD